jgi:DNA-directed RNA polymerase subunit beta'
MRTTVGNILINDLLPEPLRKYDRKIDKKEINNILNEVGKNHADLYPEIAQNLKSMGEQHAYKLSSSFSLEDFKPIDINHIYNKYEPKIKSARDIKDEVQRDEALKKINLEMESDVNSKVKIDLNHPNRFHEWITSGSKGKPDNLRQISYSVGNQVNVRNQMMSHYVDGNLSNGLSPMNYLVAAAGARKGVVGSFISVRDPGAFAKELYTLTNDMVTTMHDCGTHQGEAYNVFQMDIMDRALCEDAGPFKRNQILTPLVVDQLKKHGITKVIVRTPLHCIAREGVCAMCVGSLEDGTISPIGDTIGLRSAQSITEPLTQFALSSKHTGGTVQKRTAFQDISQVMHVPENFPGGAVLALENGSVSKIENASDGGKHIFINGVSHYALPTHNLKIKQGDSINKGDILTDGIINPAQVVELKGMHEGRKSLANTLRRIYSENGVEGHPKVFETIVRATLNLGRVKDPGDNLDHNVGDIVRWNQNQHLTEQKNILKPVNEDIIGFRNVAPIMNKNRLKVEAGTVITHDMAHDLLSSGIKELNVYKEPLKLDPFMLGTERAALHKGDWLSNMGFRFVKNQLMDNMSVMKKSELHSYDPIPAYISGRISKREDGKF